MSQLLIAAMTALLGSIGGYFVGVQLERHRTREWARKERWGFKRVLYMDLLQAMTAFRGVQTSQFIVAKWISELKQCEPLSEAQLKMCDQLDSQSIELRQKSEATDDQLQLALQRAATFLGDEVADAMKEFRSCFKASPPGKRPQDAMERSKRWLKCLGTLEEQIQKSARRDFDQL